MGNVNMEAKQIHDRTEAGKHQTVADHLKALDAVAQQIENLPTFTSNDRSFLEGLPAFPSDDGSKVLTATTSSGDTTLSYGEIPNELPADPETDGVKVLTATTESGATVKSWEEPESGVVDYSTTEQNTGSKWIDGKDIYVKTIDCGALPNNTSKSVDSGLSHETIIKMDAFAYRRGNFYPLPFVSVTTLADCLKIAYSSENHTIDLQTGSDKSSLSAYATLYYTKTA